MLSLVIYLTMHNLFKHVPASFSAFTVSELAKLSVMHAILLSRATFHTSFSRNPEGAIPSMSWDQGVAVISVKHFHLASGRPVFTRGRGHNKSSMAGGPKGR